MADRKKSAVREILEDENSDRLDFIKARALAYSVPGEMEDLGKLVEEAQETYRASRASEVRTRSALCGGVGLCIMGRYEEACAALEPVSDHKDGAYFLGVCRMETGDYEAAVKVLDKATRSGQDAFVCGMTQAEALRRAGRRSDALAKIREFQESHEKEAELHYQKGRLLEDAMDYEAAMEAYEEAVKWNPQHTGALFRLAYWNDLRGNDDRALDHYERAAAIHPTHVGVLLNLGVLYEDHGEYEKAARTYERVLEADPRNPIARMFHKDARASMAMYYDEALERRQTRTGLLLRMSLSDFELSVRSRSALERMNIRTLGDLARLTEEDLTRFGSLDEASLPELRQLLGSKGLRFGMVSEETDNPSFAPTEGPARMEGLSRPIEDLDLSIRSQKCMRSLGIHTMDDLMQKTEKELLQCQNFGQTSLDEIERKLEAFGLSLKPRTQK